MKNAIGLLIFVLCACAAVILFLRGSLRPEVSRPSTSHSEHFQDHAHWTGGDKAFRFKAQNRDTEYGVFRDTGLSPDALVIERHETSGSVETAEDCQAGGSLFFAALLDRSKSPELRKFAGQCLVERNRVQGAAAIVVAILSGEPEADCNLFYDLIEILTESESVDNERQALQDMACSSRIEGQERERFSGAIARMLGGSLTDEMTARQLAASYLSHGDPQTRERTTLVESPYLKAAMIIEAERQGSMAAAEERLAEFSAAEGTLESFMFLAGESELPMEMLSEALLETAARYRNRGKDILAGYLTNVSSSERMLAAQALMRIEETEVFDRVEAQR